LGFLPDDIKSDCKQFLQSRDVVEPMPFSLFLGISDQRVSHVSCGMHHVCVVNRNGEAFTWGSNSRGQLGLGRLDDDYMTIPSKVKMFETVKMSACGDWHTLLLATQGIIYFFGYNVAGSQSEKTHLQYTPESLQKIKNVVYISAGPYHSAAICVNTDAASESNREVYLWGRGWNYQLANKKKDTITKPSVVRFSKFYNQ
jgi:alpha-tubulin suppressor-like RCC1 family protein